MTVRIDSSWGAALTAEFEKPYFADLVNFVKAEYTAKTVYPPAGKIFAAFDRTPFDKVKVVILGQDPYHEPGQAQGLCFYVPDAIKPPPSLLNIAKELESNDTLKSRHSNNLRPNIPDLLSWTDQGVLLLNATLTVEAHKAGSHQGRGWERFTDEVIRLLATRREHLVFILWGAYAQRKGGFIDRKRHLVLESAHPSPLSAYRGFFGSKPFEKANEYLSANGAKPIAW